VSGIVGTLSAAQARFQPVQQSLQAHSWHKSVDLLLSVCRSVGRNEGESAP